MERRQGSNACLAFASSPRLRFRPDDWRVCPSGVGERILGFGTAANRERGVALSKIVLVWTQPATSVSSDLLRQLRRAARALLRTLRHSRARAALKIIQDHRHWFATEPVAAIDSTQQK
jgi:hypothetical protein